MNHSFIFILLSLFFGVSSVEIQLKKGWIKPNAWGNVENDEEFIEGTNLNYCLKQHHNTVLVFYKKLLTMLFNRENYSKINDEQLQQTVTFTIKENELKLFENSVDPRDWDEFVTKVFVQAQFGKTSNTVEKFFKSETVDNFLCNVSFFFENSWNSFVELNASTITVALIIIIFVLHTKYQFNLIALVLLAMFSVGYFKEYKECNNELVIENMINALDKEVENPCEDFTAPGSMSADTKPWYKFWMKPSKKELCIEYLRKRSKQMQNISYCTPDDVFLRYFYNVYMKQFEMLTRKSTEIFQKIIGEISFPLNIIAATVFCVLITTFLTLFFKYIIAPLIYRLPNLKEKEELPQREKKSNHLDESHHEKYQEIIRLQNENCRLANEQYLQLASMITPILSVGSKVQVLEKLEIEFSKNPAIEPATNQTEEMENTIKDNENLKETTNFPQQNNEQDKNSEE